jgi:hypothetical protein
MWDLVSKSDIEFVSPENEDLKEHAVVVSGF